MIAQLIPGMKDLKINGKIDSKSEKRSVNTRYGKTFVCDVLLKDESGKVELTLWGDQAGLVKEGDNVEIHGAYTTEWQGITKLNIPKSGEIKKV
ncbi:Single-stranded DNA binding protein Ssb [Candidatus Tiddalikarchaeum anstoanum]|nr:Single-stranded DNA binding protein Ssb [Candidatus Tiddalikarchaeum anstoanum]